MKKFGEIIVKLRVPIVLVAILLLIPSAWGYFHTGVNYDILSYLPEDIETMKGQDILVDEFGNGAFSFLVVEDMQEKDISALKTKIEAVDHVSKVLWYDSFVDISVPMEVLPDEVVEAFNSSKANSTLMMILFDETTSASGTMEAIQEIRGVTNTQCFLSGMSTIVTDTKNLSEKETPIYVCIAVVCSAVVLGVTMDSFLIPIIFLLSIGMAIVYNLGTNVFLGEISYITKALSAVLQLGVTMDYSIFLWHSYKEEQENTTNHKEAMSIAIKNTLTSVIGSSITTVAGFIALCFMSFTLGMDLGIVMAKGVIFGVVCCVTVLPSMILLMDKWIAKFSHKPLLPKFQRLSSFITKHYLAIVVLFVVLLVPAIYGNNHTPVYYNLDETLPDTLDCIVSQKKLNEQYDMNCAHMILADSALSTKTITQMNNEIKQADGVKSVLGLDSLLGANIPEAIIPESLKGELENENYKIILVVSEYKVATDEANEQCDTISNIIKKYDSGAMLVGEAPCTKDLIRVTDNDFKTVSMVSIGVIFLIILLIFKSISIPVVLVAVIEFAIFVNMAIPYYTNVEVPFIASIVIGTIQLGATVDYAILMTTRYKKERCEGADKHTAITSAHRASIQSVMVSALSFFGATFGVGVYSEIDMISSLCTLMARGAIISMFVVIFVLPSVLMVFDKVICLTSAGFLTKEEKREIPLKIAHHH